jgi:transcriptional regulator with XRE-family HTH domain
MSVAPTARGLEMEKEDLARRLRVLRAEKNWGLVEATKNLGIAPHTLADAESGRRIPRPDTLEKIAKGYGVPLGALFTDAPVRTAELVGEPAHLAGAPATGQVAPPDEVEVLEEWDYHSEDELRLVWQEALAVVARARADYPDEVRIGAYIGNDVVEVRAEPASSPTSSVKRTTGKRSRKRAQRAARNLQG